MGGPPAAHIFHVGVIAMKNGLTGLKNFIWAAAILAALLALLVGMVFAMSTSYKGERDSGTMTLGEKVTREKKSAEADAGLDAAPAVLRELPATQKNTLESVFGMTFLIDRTVLGLRTYCENYGDGVSSSIWTDGNTGLSAYNAADTPIIFVDGSLITPSNAAMISKPKTIVIYLGGDKLAETGEMDFIDGYTRLIASLRDASPNTQIIVCSIASVSTNYQGGDGLTPELIARANEWIRQVCLNTGVWYADIASILNDDAGYLSDAYLTPDGRSVAAAGIALIVDYFRFHGVS